MVNVIVKAKENPRSVDRDQEVVPKIKIIIIIVVIIVLGNILKKEMKNIEKIVAQKTIVVIADKKIAMKIRMIMILKMMMHYKTIIAMMMMMKMITTTIIRIIMVMVTMHRLISMNNINFNSEIFSTTATTMTKIKMTRTTPPDRKVFMDRSIRSRFINLGSSKSTQ